MIFLTLYKASSILVFAGEGKSAGMGNCVQTERFRDHLETVGLRTHGRVGALDFQPRLNTTKAIDHVHAIRLDAQDFHDLLSLDIDMVEAVFRGLCRRIRENR